MYSDCCRLFSLPSADIRYRGCSFRLASDRPARFCQPSYIVSAERDKKSILETTSLEEVTKLGRERPVF